MKTMSRIARNSLALIVLLVAVVLEGVAQTEEPKIVVRVYNRSHMRVQTLIEGEQVAGRILRRAGVQSAWVNCPLRGGEAVSDCRQPADSTWLVLTILQRWRSTASEASMLGMAEQNEDSVGSYCYVFQERLDDLVGHTHISASRLLGHAIAHEVGHLLKGSNSHSAEGIMAANWYADQIGAANREALNFTLGDIAVIRARSPVLSSGLGR
jgi:hypothetical protein